MGGKSGKGWLGEWKERLDRWLDALEGALAGRPQPAPVPVKRPK